MRKSKNSDVRYLGLFIYDVTECAFLQSVLQSVYDMECCNQKFKIRLQQKHGRHTAIITSERTLTQKQNHSVQLYMPVTDECGKFFTLLANACHCETCGEATLSYHPFACRTRMILILVNLYNECAHNITRQLRVKWLKFQIMT